MSDHSRKLVVTGATGKQGGALIRALTDLPSQPFEIYAVTRDASSAKALALASRPHVHVVQGDFADPAAIFAQTDQPWGLFSVTNPMNAKTEEVQGKAMTTAALVAGIQHIVFTATDRGEHSDTDPTPVPHFASKFHIERDIIAQSAQHGTTYTFLRPTAFFENLSNDFFGRCFTAMWRDRGLDRKLQLVSTADIGRVAAQAFLRSSEPGFRNEAISLAGAELTPNEAARIFREATGQGIISTYAFIGRALQWMLRDHLGIMFAWFESDGYAVDVPALRSRFPFLMDFRTWLEKESTWKTHEQQ